MSDKFDGYCFDALGRYTRPTPLSGPEEIFQFCENNKNLHHEVRIIEPREDAIIVQVTSGLYVYPSHGNNSTQAWGQGYERGAYIPNDYQHSWVFHHGIR